MTKKIPTAYDTTAYENGTGRKPKGYGAWAFEVEYIIATRGATEKRQVWVPAMSYTDAKRVARQKAVALIPYGVIVDEMIISAQP